VTGRTSSFIGPTIFGLLAAEATEWYMATQQMAAAAAEEAGHRLALFSIVAFLVAGLIILLTVNERRGREAALTAAGSEVRSDA
jgi:MFS-type transporter involved in bile tolerance (Atg22 family)